MDDVVDIEVFKSLTADYDNIWRRLKELERQYTQLQNERDNLNGQLQNCRTDPTEINRLKQEIDNLNSQLQKCKNDQMETTRLRQEINNLNHQLQNCRTDPMEINRLKQEIDRLKDNILKLEIEKNNLNNKNAQLEDRFIKIRADAQLLNNINIVDRVDIQRNIRDAVKSVEEEKEKINKLYIDCEIKSKDMQRSINEMEITINDLKTKNEILHNKVIDCETKLNKNNLNENNLNETDLIKLLNKEIDELKDVIKKSKSKKSKKSKKKIKNSRQRLKRISKKK